MGGLDLECDAEVVLGPARHFEAHAVLLLLLDEVHADGAVPGLLPGLSAALAPARPRPRAGLSSAPAPVPHGGAPGRAADEARWVDGQRVHIEVREERVVKEALVEAREAATHPAATTEEGRHRRGGGETKG